MRLNRSELELQYLELVGNLLPAAAHQNPTWSINQDHCFARVLLDAVCGDVWYKFFRPPAYRNLPQDLLTEAIQLGRRCLEQPSLLTELNRRSLDMRREYRRQEKTGKPVQVAMAEFILSMDSALEDSWRQELEQAHVPDGWTYETFIHYCELLVTRFEQSGSITPMLKAI